MLDFHFEANHVFMPIDTLYMEVILPEDIHFGAAAITLNDNLGKVVGAKSGNVLSLTFYDMYLVSNAGDFTPEEGNSGLIFNAVAVPEPGTVGLLGLGAAGLLLRRRR